MKRVAEALTVSRSRLAERVKDPARERPPRYSKAEDEVLLPLIRDIIDHRLTYGYRRVCAVQVVEVDDVDFQPLRGGDGGGHRCRCC